MAEETTVVQQKVTIKTDGKWKNFKYRYEVPAKILKDQFDYLDEDEMDGFFKYRRYWYHTSMFMRGGPEGWDGAAADSYFSGVLIRLHSDGEQYMVGSFFS